MKAKSTQLLFLIIIGIAVISSSCEAPKAFPCEKGVGERVTETLTLDPFDNRPTLISQKGCKCKKTAVR